MARVFVTGGSGFIGTNLIESLLQDGFEVANFDFHAPRIEEHNRFLTNGDIRDGRSLTKALVDFRPEGICPGHQVLREVP
jgi:nucleoside-diphosphate-sugar epimerase